LFLGCRRVFTNYDHANVKTEMSCSDIFIPIILLLSCSMIGSRFKLNRKGDSRLLFDSTFDLSPDILIVSRLYRGPTVIVH